VLLGTTTSVQVRELFGPPAKTTQFSRLQREAWEYHMDPVATPFLLVVQFSSDGVVREIFKIKDYSAEPPSGGGNLP
jgi:hypothetical protein